MIEYLRIERIFHRKPRAIGAERRDGTKAPFPVFRADSGLLTVDLLMTILPLSASPR